jgi:type VI secretion system protein ImpJ
LSRLTRATNGQFQVDHRFVPPCLTLASHPLHLERINRLVDILQAKSVALGTRRGERPRRLRGVRSMP